MKKRITDVRSYRITLENLKWLNDLAFENRRSAGQQLNIILDDLRKTEKGK